MYQDRPYRPSAFAPNRPTNLSQSELPNPAINDRRSPLSPLNRSATLPLTPPSPEARSQDGAFPIFPTSKSKSRSNTPTTPSESSFLPFSNHTSLQNQSNSFGIFAPLSPKRRGGDDVLKRLDALSPGPFDTNNTGDIRNSGHKRTGTSSSREDFIRSPNSGSFGGHSPQSSNASSYHTRNTSLASLAGGPWRNKSTEIADVSTMSAVSDRPSTSDNHSGSLKMDHSETNQSRPVIGQLGRSQTSPVETVGMGSRQETSSISQRVDPSPPQSRPTLHRPRPSVAAANRPLDEIGSMSSFKPSRSLGGRKDSKPTIDTSESLPPVVTDTRSDQRLQDAPPVPRPTRALDFGIGNPYHLSTESASSNDSSGSDVKTSSSRSSPPLSESPQRPKRKADTSKLDNLLSEFRLDLDTAPILEHPAPPRWASPPSFSRPLYSKPTETSPYRDSATISPTSNTHSLTRDGDGLQSFLTPATSTDGHLTPTYPAANQVVISPSSNPVASPDEDLSPVYPLNQGTLRAPPASYPPLPPPKAPLPRPRRTATKKGSCRGCGELIMGKSVSSADGRLTGRYHKPCFVCKTCKEPFQTADFYVMNNHPYCGRHYHQLNDSLCKSCDRGIEGQYLETELKQKFHPHCFTCQVSFRDP